MLARIFLHILFILFFVTLVACSDSANEADPISNPDVPPTTSITPNQEYISNQKDIVFTCKDSNVNDSCVSTYYTWEDTPLTLEPKNLFRGKINAAGNNAEVVTVKYFSIDKAGNKEGLKTKSYIMDIDPPTVTPSVDPTQVYSQTQWVSFNCDNGGSGSPCKFIHYYTTTDGSANPEIVESIDSAIIQLNQDTTIYFRAEDEAGAISAPQEVSYTFSTQINNVNNLKVAAGDGVVNLSWEPPFESGSTEVDPNLSGYRILRKEGSAPSKVEDPEATVLVLSDPTATSFADVGVNNNTKYFYSIWSYDGATPIANFSTGIVVSAIPAVDQAPKDVTGLNIIAGNGKVDFVWKNPENDFTYLEIRRDIVAPPANSTDGDLIYKGVGDAFTDAGLRTFTDIPLTNHIKYYYRVFAFDSANQSSPGVGGDATPSDVLPGSVTNFKISAGEASMSLSWVKPADEDLAKITIVRNAGKKPFVDNNGALIRGSVVTSCGNDLALTNCIDETVAKDKQYYYGAYATDAGGNASAPVITGPYALVDVAPPEPVSQVATTQGDGRILLKWVNPSDADFAEVKILRSAIGQPNKDFPDAIADVSKFNPGKETSYLDEGLQNNITYYYSLYTEDLAGNKSPQVSISLNTQAEAIAPELASTDPVHDSINVDPTKSIVATFNEDILSSSVSNLANNAMTVTTNQMGLSNVIIPGSVSQIDTNAISFSESRGLLPLATNITVSLSAEISDLSNNLLNSTPTAVPNNSNTWSFTTEDGLWASTDSIGVNQIGLGQEIPRVAMSNDGSAMVVWTEVDDISNLRKVIARPYSPKTGWGTANTISSTTTSGSKPAIATDKKGNYIVVWFRGSYLYATRYLVGKGWNVNEILLQNDLSETVGITFSPLNIIVNENGRVTLGWVQDDGLRNNIWVRIFDLDAPDVDWDAKPANLPPAEMIEWNNDNDRDPANPSFAEDANGNIIAVWRHQVFDTAASFTNYAILFNYFDGSSWTQPIDPLVEIHPYPPITNIDKDAYPASRNSIDVDKNGNAIVVWRQREVVPFDPADNTIYDVAWASHFDPVNKVWSGPEIISTNNQPVGSGRNINTEPVIAMRGDGIAVAVWNDQGNGIHANQYTPTTLWIEDIAFSVKSADTSPVLKFDRNGNALLVFDNGSKAVAQRYKYGTTWDDLIISDIVNTTILETLGTTDFLNNVDFDIASDGTAVAVWSKYVAEANGYETRTNIFKYRPTAP